MPCSLSPPHTQTLTPTAAPQAVSTGHDAIKPMCAAIREWAEREGRAETFDPEPLMTRLAAVKQAILVRAVGEGGGGGGFDWENHLH